MKTKKKEAKTKGTKSQNARKFFWGDLNFKKTCLKLRNQLATQKTKRRLLKLCNGANNVQFRVWRRDEIFFLVRF